MIENLMKAVKSSNKKKGRNITVGAVVGFLLSCTAVMGTDEYLWIRENAGEIEFNTALTTDKDGTDGKWNKLNPYEKNGNEWDGSRNTYINNTTLSSSTNNGNNNRDMGYGLRLSGNLENFNFINKGLVNSNSKDNGYSYGIYISDSNIGSIENGGIISGKDKDSSFGIYITSSKVGDIINEGIISGSGYKDINEGFGSGIYITSSTKSSNIINKGLIGGDSYIKAGTISRISWSNGIYIYGSEVGDVINEGLISGYAYNGSTKTGSDSWGNGIYISDSEVGDVINEGLISGYADKYSNTGNSALGYGICIDYSIVGAIINEGLISGRGYGKNGIGVYIRDIEAEAIMNKGLISGNNYSSTGKDYGIWGSGMELKDITNTGVIYGTTNAIYNNGTVNNAVNYGILANGDSLEEVVDGLTVTNHGLVIKNGVINGTVETTPQSFQIEFENGTREMTIENKENGSVTGNKTNHILNGVTDTYKAGNANNEITDSIINAYKTAVAFDTAGGKLTLSGTVVNGGLDGKFNASTGKFDTEPSNTVKGSDNADTLGLYNTIINGNIAMGTGADTLTIGNGTIINGTLDGGTGNDTLNFDSPAARTSNSDEIRIQHNVSGFENMNINTNVTLFEKTIGSDGKLADLTVTGADNITIGKNGVLTLRIDPTNKDGNAIKGHALYTTTGTLPTTTISSTGGKLLLALNGAGNSSIISFGSTVLDNTLITGHEGEYQEDVTLGTTSILHSVKRVAGKNNEIEVTALNNLPLYNSIHGYKNLNKIYQGILSVNELGNFNVSDDEKFSTFLTYLNNIYGGNPYSFSSELSRKSAGMFRDIVTENQFKANTGKWMIYGGLTHVDGGTKDTYYGKGYYTYDVGSSYIDADTKITGAYMLGEYGVSDTLTSGIVIGGNRLKSDLSNGSKVDGSALYLGAYAKKYIGNLKVTGGAGFQYGDYDADRLAVNKVASEEAESVMKYSGNYNDITYDIYLNGRYSHNIGENLFLEPYGTLSYTYIDQDGADEGGKTLAIETNSKSFDYTTAKVGADLKKIIPHEKGKSTLSAGVSYTKILDGADEEFITGRFKGGRDFDILVAHKNEHSIGLNAKYALELENGILFDVKGTYSVERDSHNQSGKNRNKGEWIVGTGLGYKF